jgi:hypothetical protein
MAKKEKPASESGSRQLYEMNAEEIVVLLNEKITDFHNTLLGDPEKPFAIGDYLSEKNISDDDLFNLFFGFDFINRSDYAVQNNIADQIENQTSGNLLYEALYHEMQTRLGSELYGSEYIVNL